MQNVVVRLRIIKHMLGCVPVEQDADRGILFSMLRNQWQNVVFMPSWWRSCLCYAAETLNMYHTLAPKVEWSHDVKGRITIWKRMVKRTRKNRIRYALHETFAPGTVITLRAILPAGLTIDNLRDLLHVGGKYQGVSPYRIRNEVFGLFSVDSIELTRRSHDATCSDST